MTPGEIASVVSALAAVLALFAAPLLWAGKIERKTSEALGKVTQTTTSALSDVARDLALIRVRLDEGIMLRIATIEADLTKLRLEVNGGDARRHKYNNMVQRHEMFVALVSPMLRVDVPQPRDNE
jgi:hypothetical protein